MAEPVGAAGGRLTSVRMALTFGAVAFVAVGGVGGWLGYQILEDRRDVADQNQLVDAARQGAINLTTIGHTTVDDDIKRILESSSGAFHDDFQKRAEPFANVVKQAQSTSEGSVTSAALESVDGDTAQVLVVMSVTMSNNGAAQQEPSVWRMRIGVEKTGDTAKVSDVQFV